MIQGMGLDKISKEEIPQKFLELMGDIESIIFPRQGYTSDVGIIKSINGIYALKRTKGEQFCGWLKKEAEVLKALKHGSKLPVPRIYGFIEEKVLNQAWALFEGIQGQTLRSALFTETNEDRRRELIFNFGKVLRKIHSVECPAELKHSEVPWIDQMLLKAEYNLVNYGTEGSAEVLNKLKVGKPEYVEQTLIHGDFTIDNVLVEGTEIKGIIDWSGGAYGDPRYDVTLAIRPKPRTFQTEEEVEVFFEGYGKKIIDDETYEFFGDNGLYAFF